jgi:hypothetical protein
MPSFGFKGNFVVLEFDGKKFTKEMERRAFQLMREAAREWVRAVYVKVPVWTGMARGALKYAQGRVGPSAGLFLSEYLKILIPIGPERTHDGKPLEVRKDKSPQIGGRKARYTFSYYKGQFNFTLNIDIVHYEINEFHAGHPPSYSRPWNSFQAGDEAFKAYIDANVERILPNVNDYTRETKIKANG